MSHDTTLEFFFDIGSPYSYLAATQCAEVAERCGAELEWRPFLLGGVFKSTGNTMPAAVENKAKYMLADLRRWAEHYDVPFRMSSHFPINSLIPQRALCAAQRLEGDGVDAFALTLFRDYWVEDIDVSKLDAVHEAAERAGYDPDEVVEQANDQSIKDILRAETDEAVERGAFGAPTFFVGEQMFWGNDRLRFVEEALGS
jgi:2-hydroxychromene-2-carboxylate isomerase